MRHCLPANQLCSFRSLYCCFRQRLIPRQFLLCVAIIKSAQKFRALNITKHLNTESSGDIIILRKLVETL